MKRSVDTDTPIANHKRKFARHLAFYVTLSLLAMFLCPMAGTEKLDFTQIISNLFSGEKWSVDTQILFSQRLPRIILAFIVGGTLAMVGSVFQVILRNPLATPYTLGVTSGAALGAFIGFSLPLASVSFGPFSSVQIFSLAGAGIVFLLIYLVSCRPAGISTNTLLLAGVTIGIMCGALTLLVRYLTNPNLLVSMDRWLMGRLDIVGYSQVAAILPLVLIGLIAILSQIASLNHLALGGHMAMGHGVNVKKTLLLCFIGGSLATAGAISVAGPIGFIGLLVPHSVRKISGYDHRIILPASFFAGGSFLIICDTIARTIIPPTEMPVGIITALLGSPFFIYLLVRKK